MKRFLLLSMMLLSACQTTVPAIPKFPEPPVDLNDPEPLTPLQDPATMTMLLRNAAENYGKYHSLAAQYHAWIEWYKEQSKIFNTKAQ